MDKLVSYKAGMILVPLLSGVVGSSMIAFEIGRLNRLKTDRARATGQVTLLTRQINETTAPPTGGRYPVVAISPAEQPQFLNTLRGYADNERVEIVRWTNVPGAPPSATGVPDDKKKAALPANVSTIISTVEIKGHYNDARRFLYDLLYCPRLLTMNDIKWVRGEKWPLTQVTFTLTRYVIASGKA